MKNIFFALIIGSLLGSCTALKFDRPPGEKLSEIPPELQGNYKPKTSWFKKQDSVLYVIDAMEIKTMMGKEYESWGVNRDMAIHKLEDYYILAYPDNDIKKLWNLAVIDKKGNQLNLYYLVKDNKTTKSSGIENYMPPMQLNLEHGPVESPGASSMVEALPTTMSGDPDKTIYYIMDDNMFINFLKAEIKNMEPFVIVKQKASKK